MPDGRDLRRVLMTADTLGGVFTYALDLACGLGAKGIEVALLTMGARLGPAQRARVHQVGSTVQVYQSEYKLEWMDEPWNDLKRAADWLLAKEDEIQPDIVHLNQYAHGCLPWRAPHVVVGHSCVLSWWRAVRREEVPSSWNRYRTTVRNGLAGADLVVAPGRAMMDELQRYYGPLARTAVIPNARPESEHRTGAKEPFIFSAGRVWDEAKNIAALSSVAATLDWPILVAGDNCHPSRAEATSTAGVKFLGHLSQREVADYFSRAAIYCLPARYEPFGLSILEAAISGCALVLGDIPSLRENWDAAAEFVAPDDAAQLGHRLRQLTSDPGRVRELSRRALERSGRFTMDAMVSGYVAAYDRLTRSSSLERVDAAVTDGVGTER